MTPFNQSADLLVHGDYVVAGNGVLTCPAGANCTNMLTGGGSTNDANSMVYTGPTSTMLNSSSATITIPSGAKIVRAKLLWSGSMGTASPATTTYYYGSYYPTYNVPARQTSCSPNTSTYLSNGRFYYDGAYYSATLPAGSPATTQPTIIVNGTATKVPIDTYRTDQGMSAENADYYAASGDVMAALQSLPTGASQTVTVGNIWAPQGNNCMGGWALQVVYDFGAYVPGNNASVLREVYSFDGYVREFSGDNPTTVTLNGLKVQGTGAKAAFVAYEGDEDIAGDYVTYSDPSTGATNLNNPQAGSTNNMFVGYSDGSVKYPPSGGSTTSGTFYNGSVDARTVQLPGLASGDTSMNLKLGTTQDSYLLQNVTISVPMAEITILKTAGNGEKDQAIQPGAAPDFRITIYNSGAVNLLNMRVEDVSTPSCAMTQSQLDALVKQTYSTGQIPAGGSVQYTCAGSPTSTSYDNTASVTGYTPNGLVVNNSGVAKVLVGTWDVTKTNKTPDVPVGTNATWIIKVANTGQADIYNVQVTDQAVSACNRTVALVQAGQTLTYECQGIVNGTTTNSVSATGTAKATENATITVPMTDTATATPVYVSGIDVTKTANKTMANVNEDVTFTFTVKNTGTSTLNTVSLTDPEFSACNQTNIGPLAAGATRTVTCTVKAFTSAAAAALTNHVTAVGTPPSGITVTDSDQVVVNNKSLKLAKSAATTDTNGNGVLDAGDTVRYSFTVTNTGSSTLTGVKVTDPRLAGTTITCTPTTLATSAVATCTAAAPYTVTQADVDAGTLVNTATATGTASDGSTTTGTAAVTLTPVQQPAIDITKTATPSTVNAVGQTVAYTFVVTNTGNTTLTGITPTDPLTGLSAVTCRNAANTTVATPTSLAPGAALTCTASRATTQADLNAGRVVNTASVSGTSPKGTVVNDTASVTVQATQRPALEITKSADATTFATVGQVVNYTFATRNTGNVTLSGVTMSDPMARLANRTCTPAQPAVLAPGQSVTCTATLTVTQADIDGGAIVNTASVTANPPTGSALTGSASWTVSPATSPGIALAKTASRETVTAAGQAITYTLTATNQGNTTLSNVQVTDPMSGMTMGACTPALGSALAPGAKMTCTGSYTSTQADVDRGSITNTAAASATDSHGSPVNATATKTVAATPAPAIQLTKSANPSQVSAAGQSVTYTFAVRNTGNVTLSSLALADPMAGLSAISCAPTALGGQLAPGATTSCTATRATTVADMNAGAVTNTATASGTSPGGAVVTAQSSARVTATQTPAFTIAKSASPTQVTAAGQRITWSIVVTNSGNVSLTNLRISDPKVATLSCTPTAAGGALAPGAATTCTASYVTTLADMNAGTINNTASATLTPPSGADISHTSSAVVTTQQTPSLSTTKTGSRSSYAAVGDVINYTITSTNTGNVSLSNVQVVDPLFPSTSPLACTPTQGGTLAPGASITCTGSHAVTQAELDAGSLVNTATGRGTNPAGGTTSSTSTFTATATQNPAFTLTKTASPATISTVGRAITFTVVLTNTGNVSLTGATIADPRIGDFSSCTPALGSTVTPGNTMTCTGSYTSTQADVNAGSILNTATASATPPSGAALGRTAQAVVAITQNPALTLTKTANPGRVSTVGQQVTYSFLVTNTGNVTARGITVSDPMVGLSAVTCPVTTLNPGASTTCTANRTTTQADLNAASGKVDNTATVNATDENARPFPAVSSSASVAVTQNPVLSATKTASPTTVSTVGTPVSYTITVRNSGNVEVTDVVPSDNLIPAGGLACTPAQGSSLAPGATMTCTATRATTQGDLDAGRVVNTVTTTGTAPNGSAVTPAVAQATVTARQLPDVSLTKTPSRTTVDAVGETITYTYQVTNTGNVSLGSMRVTDPHQGLTAINCAGVSSLVPGASATCTASYSTTQTDLNAGSIPDTATVRAEKPGGDAASSADDVTATASALVTANQAPALSFSKSASQPSYTTVGRVITYTFNTQNTGNVDIVDVRVGDTMAGLSALSCTPAQGSTLAPQATMTCTATRTITQADIDAQRLVNNATVTGRAPDGSTIRRTAQETITATLNPAMTFSKSGSPTTVAAVGQTIDYRFAVANTGNTTMSGITVADPMPGLSAVTCQATSLAPGDTTTCSASYTTTQADLDRGSIQNTATLRATDPAGTALTRTSSFTVQATQTPELSLDKTADRARVETVGDVVNYSFRVTNTGNVTAGGLTVTDLLEGLSPISCPATSLAPGATMTCTASYETRQSDLDNGRIANTAIVTGTAPGDVAIPPASDQVQVAAVQRPERTFAKAASPALVDTVGQVVTYTFTTTNTGNVTLGGVRITDPLAGLSTLTCQVLDANGAVLRPGAGAIALAPGETKRCTATYSVKQSDLNAGSIANTAASAATLPGGEAMSPLSASAVVTATQNPAIQFTKAADTATYTRAGQVVTYTLTLSNTGNVDLTDARISDPLDGLSAPSCSPAQGSTLAPKATMRCTANYTIKQADMDNLSLPNTATGAATVPGGTRLTQDSSRTLTATLAPSVNLTKSASPNPVTAAGQLVTYSFVVTNTGNATLSGVAVADPLPGLSAPTCPQTTLAPGDSTTCTATMTTTQAHIDAGRLANTATASGTDPAGTTVTKQASAVLQVTQDPALTLTKTADVERVTAAGQQVTYTFVVRNTGNTTINQIAVSDPMFSPNAVSCPASSLTPGASTTCTRTWTVTQAQIDAGGFTNTATATGATASGAPVPPATGSATVDAPADPSWTFVKTADDTTVDRIGQTVTYTLVVTNTGNVTLDNVFMSDPKVGPNRLFDCYVLNADGSRSMDAPGAISLLPGQQKVCHGARTFTQPDFEVPDPVAATTGIDWTNQATVNAVTPDGTALPTLSSSPAAGQLAGPTTVYLVPKPDFEMTKVADVSGFTHAGQQITYQITATNTGNVELNDVRVTDVLSPLQMTCAPALGSTLQPGEVMQCTAVYTSTVGDTGVGAIVNSASARGTDNQGAIHTATDAAVVELRYVGATGMALDKTASPSVVTRGGQEVTYTFTVTNLGESLLDNIVLTDGMAGLSAINCPSTSLDPAGDQMKCTATYTVTQADIDRKSIVNTARLEATSAGRQLDPTTATATVTAQHQPRLTLAKTGTPRDAAVDTVGDQVDYSFTVTNTGNVAMADITLTDPMPGLSTPTCQANSLAPGASTTCTATLSVNQAQLDQRTIRNTATVSASDLEGKAFSATAAAQVPTTWVSGVTLTKTADPTEISQVGQGVTYTFTQTNTGRVTLYGLRLVDSLAGRMTTPVCTPSTTQLAPGASRTCTASLTVTQADLDAGGIVNDAGLTTTLPDASVGPQAQASAVVTAQRTSSIEVTKNVDQATYSQVGQQLNYTIVVRNTGNVSATGVQVSDSLPGISALSCTPALGSTLGGAGTPNDTMTCTTSYQVGQADLDARSVSNTATATAGSATGPLTDDSEPAVSTAQLDSRIAMTKYADPSQVSAAGQVVTYTFEVRNTGNATVHDLTVSDVFTRGGDLATLTPSCPRTTLAPTEQTTCTVSHTVTQTDIDQGVPAQQLGLANTATASATAPDGATVTTTDATEVQVVQNPAITMDKTVSSAKTDAAGEPTYDAVGDVLRYTIKITNTGNVTVLAGELTDPLLSNVSCDAYSLAPGGVATCTGDYTVTQHDIDAGTVHNTATATARDEAGDPVRAQDSVDVAARLDSRLLLTKTGSPTGVSTLGETVTYTFVATNAGNTTLSNVFISDPIPSLSMPLVCRVRATDGTTRPGSGPVSLAPGEVKTCTATRPANQADIDAGIITNTATVTADDPVGPLDPVAASAVTTVEQTPRLETTKTTSRAEYSHVGEVVGYTITVRNTGNTSVAGVRISDSMLGLTDLVCTPGQGSTLGAGQSMSCTTSHTVTQADIDARSITNIASASGTDPKGASVTDASEPVVSTAVLSPGIDLVKRVNPNSVLRAGDRVTYTFVATNTGNTTLYGVEISDPHPGLSAISCDQAAAPYRLQPGGVLECTASYQVTQEDIDGARPEAGIGIDNTAGVRGTDPAGTVVGDEASTTLQVQHRPSLAMTKVASPDTYDAVGDEITYTFTITNDGNVTLHDLDLTDPMPNISPITCDRDLAADLRPGGVVTCTMTKTIYQVGLDVGQISNTATVHGHDPDGAESSPTQASEVITAVQQPAMTLTKDSDVETVNAVGDPVTYTFVMTNTGNVTLSNVFISDQLPGLSNPLVCTITGTDGSTRAGNGPVSVAPGEKKTCTGTRRTTQTDLDAGSIVNTAQVDAGSPKGPVAPVTAGNTVTAVQSSSILLEKAVTPTRVATAGDTVTYTLSITNTGSVTLRDIRIQDDMAGLENFRCDAVDPGADPSAPLAYSLAPQGTIHCMADKKVTAEEMNQARLVNTATVQATSPDPKQPTVSSTSSATLIPVHTPKLELTKSAGQTLVTRAGQQVPFSFTVTNTGNVEIAQVSVSDPLITEAVAAGRAGNSLPVCAQTTLAVGQATTCTATYVATQADVDAGRINNTAEATGVDPIGGDPVQPGTAQAEVPVSQTPRVSLTKDPADRGQVAALGDNVPFTLVLTNDGNVTLNDARVDDGSEALTSITCLPAQPAVLAPGQKMTCTANVTAVQADLDAGQVYNYAFGKAKTPTGQEVAEVSADATVPTVKGTSSATFSKTAAPAAVTQVGEQVTYTFTVTNTGTLTVYSPYVTDEHPGLSALDCRRDAFDPLPPGRSYECTASYTVTQADLDAGRIDNTASLAWTDPSTWQPRQLTGKASVAATQKPALVTTKTSDRSTVNAAGDVVNYTFRVANTGNVTTESVQVSDPLPGLSPLRCLDAGGTAIALPATIAAGSNIVCQASYTVTQDDMDAGSVVNTAAASGRTALGQAVGSTTGESVVGVNHDPSIRMAKVADTSLVQKVGDKVTYTVTATNTGNVSIAQATITDPMTFDSWSCLPAAGSSLAPQQTMTCTGVYSVVHNDLEAGQVTNLASFTGTDPAGQQISGEAGTTVSALYNPKMAFTKEVSAPTNWRAGDLITYTFHVSNVGNMDAYHVFARDTMADLSATTCTVDGTGEVVSQDNTEAFPPGLSVTCVATYVAKQADVDRGFVTNTATLTASEATGQTFPTEVASATTATEQTASMTMDKSADVAQYTRVGQQIGYTFTITNTGQLTISGGQISDRMAGLGAISCDTYGIAPGQVATCRAGYVVTQADMDRGSLLNTASAQGRDPQGATVGPVQDSLALKAVTRPELSLTKQSQTSQVTRAGEVVQFTLSATNTGDVTASDVTVADPGATITGCDQAVPASLPPGQSLNCTVDYVVTQDDINRGSLVNTASVEGLDPHGVAIRRAFGSRAVAAQRAASVELTKRADKATFDRLGETITYTFTARNSGNTTLFGATISDPMEGLSALTCTPGQPADLDPGEVLTCTATYQVSQADLDRGTLSTTAHVAAENLGGNPDDPADDVTAEADTTLTGISRPALGLVKTTDTATVAALSDTITYSFAVTNTGNTTLHDVKVSDPFTAQGMSPISCPASSLVPGETMTCTATFNPAQKDLDDGTIVNRATATGIDPFNSPAQPGVGTARVAVDQKPDYNLTKSADHVLVSEVGEQVLYTFIGKNTGNVTLHVVEISDPLEGLLKPNPDNATPSEDPGLSCYPALPADLPPGEQVVCRAFYHVTQADLDRGQLVNTAAINGRDPKGNKLPEKTADETIQTVPSQTNIGVTKTPVVVDASAPGGEQGNTLLADEVGDVITYVFTVVNTGNQTATEVTLDDPMFAPEEISCGPNGSVQLPTVLGPEQGLQCTASHTVTQADLDGTSPHRRAKLATYDQIEAPDGQTVPVPVFDGDEPVLGDDDPRQTTEPSIFNRAAVSATLPGVRDPQTGQTGAPRRVHQIGEAAVPVATEPSFTLTKQADRSDFSAVGDPISYGFTLTNTGTTTLSGLVFIDPLLAGAEGDEQAACLDTDGQPLDMSTVTVAPGASFTCRPAAYRVTQADLDRGRIDNQVTAVAVSPSVVPGETVALDPQTARHTVAATQQPSLSFTKSSDATGRVLPGTVVTYTFAMANIGNVTTVVNQLSDQLEGLSVPVCEKPLPATLAPGETNTCTAGYTVTDADADAGTVDNTAQVGVADPAGDPVTVPPSSAVVEVEGSPSVTLVKAADLRDTNGDELGQAGEQVAYTISATNTGNVTLREAVLSDPMLGSAMSCTPAQTEPLAPGAVRTCVGIHTITADEAAAGLLSNTASFSAPALCQGPMAGGELVMQAASTSCPPVRVTASIATSVIPPVPTPPAPTPPVPTPPTAAPSAPTPPAATPSASTPPAAQPAANPPAHPTLPNTGSDVPAWLLALGLLLTAAGVVLIARKKKENA
ncbi:DUF7507 domain-containing protein [Luteococcus peritonei]|uniref:CARDB domain-containing protein n=1 Tax=Luteococcus peritonei TaxID=88874 RepID=A0ABW4RVC2_9ACTN